MGAGDIFSIYFSDLDTGYVAGGNDAFLKTENGAESWIDINFSTTFNAILLDFCSPSVGFVTDGYDLYKTNNYEENWSFITIPGSLNRIVAIEYVSNQVCYISGDDELGNTYIMKTLTGGGSWINSAFDPSLPPPTKILCLNDSVFYALSSNGLGSEFYLLKTTNGGGIETGIINTDYNSLSISIFPNPTNRIIYLNNLLLEKIISIVTQNLLEVTLELNLNEYNMAATHLLPSGIYFTEIITEGGKTTCRWVKI